MKFYRKINVKDRLPHKKGYYLFELQGTGELVSIQWNLGQRKSKGRKLMYWLESVDLGDLKFTTSTGSQDFVDGINYILDKLKDQVIE